MFTALWVNPMTSCVIQPKILDPSHEFLNYSSQARVFAFSHTLPRISASHSEKIRLNRGRNLELSAWTQEGSLQELDESPVSVELKPIISEIQFGQVISQAQLVNEPAVIVWMASWCREYVHLKPKLEKLAAEYYPRLLFHCVDVNRVPHKLVARAEVKKMPTIQLWKDGVKHGEVIGSHKAYLVVNEVRDMIENEPTSC